MPEIRGIQTQNSNLTYQLYIDCEKKLDASLCRHESLDFQFLRVCFTRSYKEGFRVKSD